MDEVDAVIHRQITQGLCTGVQAATITPLGATSWAAGVDGIGQPIDETSLSAVYCASKPLLTLAVPALTASGLLPLTATVESIIGDCQPGAPKATVADLLNHTAGVHTSDSETLKLHGYEGKRRIARAAAPPPDWSAADSAGYSEYVAWAILADIVEAVTGVPWPQVVGELVIAPADAGGDVLPVIEPEQYTATIDRIRINIDLRDRPTPLLNERGPTFACEPNPGYGAYASALGLARVLHAHLTHPELASPSITDPSERRGYRWDEVMHGRVDTQNGLLADLRLTPERGHSILG